MQIKESAENYLETIYVLCRTKGMVRSIDIVNALHFSKPSVSVAMKNFRENGYVVMDSDGYITLTDAGREIAERIYERHEVLTEMLMQIGVSEETAKTDACRMEHHLSDETFERLKEHVEKFKVKK